MNKPIKSQMLAYAYHNLKNLEDRVIDKIVPLRRFQDILLSRKFGFVNPTLWNDPYENFLLNQTISENGGEKRFEELTRTLYGSCWTFNHNTDYMWKVYLKDELGIQIKTRISRLYDHFKFLKEDPNLISFQIGRIKYEMLKDLNKMKLHPLLFQLNNYSFIKRNEYAHENEVRILLKYNETKSKVLLFHFDINKVSGTVMMDPRLSRTDYQLEKRKLEILGYKGKINQSTLYTPPKFKLK